MTDDEIHFLYRKMYKGKITIAERQSLRLLTGSKLKASYATLLQEPVMKGEITDLRLKDYLKNVNSLDVNSFINRYC